MKKESAIERMGISVGEGFIPLPKKAYFDGDKGKQLEFAHEVIPPPPSLIDEIRSNYKEIGVATVRICIISGVLYGPLIALALAGPKALR